MRKSVDDNATKTPRICIIYESIAPLRFDDSALHPINLANRFASKGLEIILILRQTEPPSKRLERFGNLLVHRIFPGGQLKGKGWNAVGPMLSYLARLIHLLIKKRHQYDIIFVSGSKILPIPAMLVSMITGKRWIIRNQLFNELSEVIAAESLHRINLSQYSVVLKALNSLRLLVIKRADRFVALSSEIRQELINFGIDTNKIHSISNGVDTDLFSPVSDDEKSTIRQKLSLPIHNIIVNFTGRLVAQKGILNLIHVWNELIRKYDNVHLLFVGTGHRSFDSQEEELKEYIRVHNLENYVTLTGEVSNVIDYLQASDIFVLPSNNEGFSTALVEALACGLPTVATRVGGATQLIDDYESGILVNPSDQQGLQKAIEWLFDNENSWTTIGLNARKKIVEEYSIEAEVEQYVEMFRELVTDERN